MDPLIVGILGVLALVILLLLGVHIAVVLGVVGIAGVWALFGASSVFGLVSSAPYGVVASFSLTVIPAFILMGHFTLHGGIGEDLFKAAYRIVGRVPGSLAMAVALANAIFGAVSGSTLAACAIFTRLAYPEMKKHGYDRAFSLACIASSGTFAAMIPPSITVVIYGIITGTSVGKTLIAGLIPGLICVALYMVFIYIRARANPRLCPVLAGRPEPWRQRLTSLRSIWTVLILFFLVMGGIYLGVFTPTEAGSVGAAGALVIALGRKRMTMSHMKNALLETGQTTSMIFLILIGGTLFSRFLALSGFMTKLVATMSGTDVPPSAILAAFVFMYLALGCILDGLSMMVITLPFVFPIVTSLGYDPVWFGIIVVQLIEIGVLTPPVGLNVYTVKGMVGDEVSLESIFGSVGFFLTMNGLTLLVCLFVPQVVLWLPSLMK